jgi:hypothetical protein
MIYRVSYMVRGNVRGKKHPGLTRDQEKAPNVGEEIKMGEDVFKVIEVQELIPPMGGFSFLHATCQWLPDA